MIEAVLVLKGLFGDGPFSFAASTTRSTDSTGLPEPHTAGGPPLIIAGGSRRMLRFAGANAAIVGVNPSIHSGEVDTDAARDGMADRMDQKMAWVREGAGGRFDDLEINAWVAVAKVTDDSAAFAELLSPGFGVPAEPGARLPRWRSSARSARSPTVWRNAGSAGASAITWCRTRRVRSRWRRWWRPSGTDERRRRARSAHARAGGRRHRLAAPR